MLCAKEIKGLCEARSALDYKDDELREFVKIERLRLEKEKQI